MGSSLELQQAGQLAALRHSALLAAWEALACLQLVMRGAMALWAFALEAA
jgi:hypothetical protein